MDLQIKGKAAVITGATRVIGRSIVETLADRAPTGRQCWTSIGVQIRRTRARATLSQACDFGNLNLQLCPNDSRTPKVSEHLRRVHIGALERNLKQ